MSKIDSRQTESLRISRVNLTNILLVALANVWRCRISLERKTDDNATAALCALLTTSRKRQRQSVYCSADARRVGFGPNVIDCPYGDGVVPSFPPVPLGYSNRQSKYIYHRWSRAMGRCKSLYEYYTIHDVNVTLSRFYASQKNV